MYLLLSIFNDFVFVDLKNRSYDHHLVDSFFIIYKYNMNKTRNIFLNFTFLLGDGKQY